MDWRKRRLRGALARLTRLTQAEYDELVPKNGRPSLQAFKGVAAASLSFVSPEATEGDKISVKGAPSEKPPIYGGRTLERASTALNLALSGLHVPLRIARAGTGYEVVDAVGAWAGDGGVSFLDRLAPEALTPVDRSALGGKLEAALARPRPGPAPIVAVVAPAGFGKTTALGQFAGRAAGAGATWVRAAFCEDYVPGEAPRGARPGRPSAGAPEGSPPLGPASTDGGQDFSPLGVYALGGGPGDFLAAGVLGTPATLAEAIDEVHAHPGGLLLVDTLDLVLADEAAAWAGALRAFAAAGVCVVLSCRSWEWDHELSRHLPGATVARLPLFTTEEASAAVELYCERNGVPFGTFGRRVLDLTQENRRLDRIVRNPLLLSLICRLFGPTGTVPQDLTVLRLYDELFERRVRQTRHGGGPDDPAAIAKTHFCYSFARLVVERTGTHVQEVLARADFSRADPKAVAELRSDGIIEELTGARLHLFHQSFLEYLVGLWLTTRPTAARRFTRKLEGMVEVPYPVAALLRMYLAKVVDPEARLDIALSLPLRSLSVFHAAALAWAAHGEPHGLLARLADLAADRPEGREEALVDALDAFNGPWSGETAELVLCMAGRFRLPALKALVPVVVQSAAPSFTPFRRAFVDALASRSTADFDLPTVLAAELGRHATASGEGWLLDLAERFGELGPKGQQAVLRALASPNARTHRDAARGLVTSLGVDPYWYEGATQFLSAVIADRPADGGAPGAFPELDAPWPGDWALHGYRALGRKVAREDDGGAVARLLARLASGPDPQVSPILVALSEAVRRGLHPDHVRHALQGTEPPLPNRRNALREVAELVGDRRRPDPASADGEGAERGGSGVDCETTDALTEHALSRNKTLAFGAAKELAARAERDPGTAAALVGLMGAPFPGVRRCAYETLCGLVRGRRLDHGAMAGFLETAARAALQEKTTASLTAALDLQHALFVEGVLPPAAGAFLGAQLKALDNEWIDGGCVVRLARVAEDCASRTPEDARVAVWEAFEPWFRRFNFARYKNAEKHLVPALRYLIQVAHDDIERSVRSAAKSIPRENLRPLYIVLSTARPDSPLVPLVRELAPEVSEILLR